MWVSIRFFDDISSDIWNEYRIYLIRYNLLVHFSLESIYRDFNNVINSDTENYILSTVFNEVIQ
jgi:hypothetical protein